MRDQVVFKLVHAIISEFSHLHEMGALGKNATIHQLTSMLATFNKVLFPGHNHMLTTGIDDPTI